MLHHKLCRPVGGHALPQLLGVVGGERLLPLLFHVPSGQRSGHLGLGGPEVFFPCYQQQAQPAAELPLGVCMELLAELLHGLALHF